jgi:hypothetical protein
MVHVLTPEFFHPVKGPDSHAMPSYHLIEEPVLPFASSIALHCMRDIITDALLAPFGALRHSQL